MQRSTKGFIAIFGLGIGAGLGAQQSDSFNVDVAECIALESDEARFACYEERVDAARSAPAAPRPAEPPRAPAPANAAAAPAPPASESEPLEPFFGNTSSAEEPDGSDILATITELRETIPNQWIITLDNGQVWQMNQAKRYPLRVGLDVRLYATRWGPSYRLTAPDHGGFVVVQRAL